MKRNFTKIVVIAVLLAVIPFAKSLAKTITVTAVGFSFSPATIPNVVVGDVIHWVYESGGPHTTTSTSVPAGAATWNSPLSNNVQSFDYTVTVAGAYTYVCTPHAPGMAGSFTAAGATGIDDHVGIFGELLLSPNPASESVRVKFNPSSPFKGSVKLFDLLGNKQWENEATFDAGLNSAEISLADIPKGVYFVILSDSRNNRAVKRLIVR